MFDINQVVAVNDEVPEELSAGAGGYTFVARVAKVGFFSTPQFKRDAAASRGDTAQDKMFMQALEPQDFRWDTAKDSYIYEQQGDLSVAWYNYRDKKGNFIQPNSPFGDIKAGYKELDHNIRNNEDCKAIEGRYFQFLCTPKEYVKGQKPVWVDIPIRDLGTSYTYDGPIPIPTKKRGYTGGESAATRVDAATEARDAEKLINTLSGVPKTQWLSALVGAGFDDPYLNEAAANDGEALVKRMSRYGMSLQGDALVKVG